MIGIFAAVGIAAIGFAHVACGTTVANSAKETGYEDASRGFWPDYNQYKIVRYVVSQIGRADFEEGNSTQWGELDDYYKEYKKGGDRFEGIPFSKFSDTGRFARVLDKAGVAYDWTVENIQDYTDIDLLTVKEVGKEKKYYK
jgi:hypothetical protein